MGCSSSTALETPDAPRVANDAIHESRRSYENINLRAEHDAVVEAVVNEIGERRAGRTGGNTASSRAQLATERGAPGLQAMGVLMSIYSTEASVFGDYARESNEYVDLPTVGVRVVNAMAGSVMLAMAREYQAAIEAGAGAGPGAGQPLIMPNATLLGPQLHNVLRFKAVWGRRCLGVTLLLVSHPALGEVALVQPLLLAAAIHRVFNWGRDPDPVFELLLQAGASPNMRNSLNMTALVLVAAALLQKLDTSGGGNPATQEEVQAAVGVACDTVRLLRHAGADPAATMLGFGAAWTSMAPERRQGALPYALALMDSVLELETYTALAAFRVMRGRVEPDLAAAVPGAPQLLDAFEALLKANPSGHCEAAVANTRPGTGRSLSWPWTQAMGNIAWAVSQVAMRPGAPARRALLRDLRREAPFALPPMSVVSVGQLRALGHIPRFSLKEPGDSGFTPLPADELPAGSVVVFVSHRWLGNGCPDDDKGTKLQQVFAITDLVSQLRGVPPDHVFLWLDYSVVDQLDPMPGVQALPVYIACCDVFVWVHHDQYWQRAWCLTEQFMHWKLGQAGDKYCLHPDTMRLTPETAHTRPPDPTYGKLAVEADRVALATMTSILPYD